MKRLFKMSCTIQSTKKYLSRNSPPYPANKCCKKTLKGNDNQMYISVANKNGVCAWKLASSKRSSKSSKSSKETKAKKVVKRSSKSSKKLSSKQNKRSTSNKKSRSKQASKQSKKSQYSVLVYYKRKLPSLSSTSAVKFVRKQHGTDNNGKTYYVDAVLKAASTEAVGKYFKGKTNFMRIAELHKMH